MHENGNDGTAKKNRSVDGIFLVYQCLARLKKFRDVRDEVNGKTKVDCFRNVAAELSKGIREGERERETNRVIASHARLSVAGDVG